MVQAIVTKSGNSYARRVPKRYIDDNHLKLGDIVTIEEPLTLQKKALESLVRQGKEKGPIKSISDPVGWQREQRRSSDPWEETDARYFERLFAAMKNYIFDDKVTRKAVELRKTNTIQLSDAIVAAAANDLTLWTHNTEDFSKVPNLRLIDPIVS